MKKKSVVDEAIRLTSFIEATLSVVHINDPAAGKAHMLMNTLPGITEADILIAQDKP